MLEVINQKMKEAFKPSFKFKLPSFKTCDPSELGAYITNDVIYIWHINGKLKQTQSRQFPIIDKSIPRVFEQIYDTFGAAKLHIVLSKAWYQILFVDKPAVPEKELRSSLTWAVKDMVSTPIQDLEIDYFDSPLPSKNKVNIVLVDKKWLKPLVKHLFNIGFDVKGVTIEPMALCNIKPMSPDARLIIVSDKQGGVTLQIVKDANLYMERMVKGISGNTWYTEFSEDQLLKFNSEINQTMQYFESEMRQSPITSLEIVGQSNHNNIKAIIATSFPHQINTNLHDENDYGGFVAKLALDSFEEQFEC